MSKRCCHHLIPSALAWASVWPQQLQANSLPASSPQESFSLKVPKVPCRAWVDSGVQHLLHPTPSQLSFSGNGMQWSPSPGVLKLAWTTRSQVEESELWPVGTTTAEQAWAAVHPYAEQPPGSLVDPSADSVDLKSDPLHPKNQSPALKNPASIQMRSNVRQSRCQISPLARICKVAFYPFSWLTLHHPPKPEAIRSGLRRMVTNITIMQHGSRTARPCNWTWEQNTKFKYSKRADDICIWHHYRPGTLKRTDWKKNTHENNKVVQGAIKFISKIYIQKFYPIICYRKQK